MKAKKGRKSQAFPICNMHADCFANKEGRCICLSSNDFGEKDCPFYKPSTDVDLNRVDAECWMYASVHSGIKETNDGQE